MGSTMNEIIKHDKNFPPTASEGGDNAYYLRGCNIVQRSPSYASCLWKLREIDAGRVTHMNSDCAAAGSRCQAREMRQQEQLQGVALYYFPRHSKPYLPAKVAGDFGVLITNLTDPAIIPKEPKPRPIGSAFPPAKKKPTSILDTIDSGTYADAINAPRAPATPAAPAPKKPITKGDLAKLALPGESLIDTAKRLLNKTKEAAHAI